MAAAPDATVLAAVPVGPLVGCYLWLDRYEPEPRSLLAAGLLWGCFVATALALLVQGVGGFVLTFTDRQSLEVVAPLTEEASKGLFLLLLLWWRLGLVLRGGRFRLRLGLLLGRRRIRLGRNHRHWRRRRRRCLGLASKPTAA